VLVTGGTGFLGSALVPRLIAAGHDVRILARGAHRALLPRGATLIKGDVVTGEGLDTALKDVAAVVHLVAVIRERGSYTFHSVNHQGTANLVQAMQRVGTRRIVHMSALGVAPEPRFRYIFSKWQGEQEVRESGLWSTIFRPSVLFGRGSGFLQRLRQSVAPAPVFAPVPGSGQARFQPIWVEDVVTCVLLALERPDSIGQTYEIGGPEYLTYEEILDLLLRTLGLRRIKVHIPLLLMRPVVRIMERVLPDSPVTSDELAQLEIDNTAELDAVERFFGFSPARMADKIDYLREE
jgi:NADH dehydrogenase